MWVSSMFSGGLFINLVCLLGLLAFAYAVLALRPGTERWRGVLILGATPVVAAMIGWMLGIALVEPGLFGSLTSSTRISLLFGLIMAGAALFPTGALAIRNLQTY